MPYAFTRSWQSQKIFRSILELLVILGWLTLLQWPAFAESAWEPQDGCEPLHKLKILSLTWKYSI